MDLRNTRMILVSLFSFLFRSGHIHVTESPWSAICIRIYISCFHSNVFSVVL